MELTVVLDYYEAMWNLRSYWTTTRLCGIYGRIGLLRGYVEFTVLLYYSSEIFGLRVSSKDLEKGITENIAQKLELEKVTC